MSSSSSFSSPSSSISSNPKSNPKNNPKSSTPSVPISKLKGRESAKNTPIGLAAERQRNEKQKLIQKRESTQNAERENHNHQDERNRNGNVKRRKKDNENGNPNDNDNMEVVNIDDHHGNDNDDNTNVPLSPPSDLENNDDDGDDHYYAHRHIDDNSAALHSHDDSETSDSDGDITMPTAEEIRKLENLRKKRVNSAAAAASLNQNKNNKNKSKNDPSATSSSTSSSLLPSSSLSSSFSSFPSTFPSLLNVPDWIFHQYSPSIGRHFTVSMALPGSILTNCQSAEQRASLVTRIARAAAIHKVDEIVIFSENNQSAVSSSSSTSSSPSKIDGTPFRGIHNKKIVDNECDTYLCRILQYLECPQYLRKLLFPVHVDLKSVSSMAPLDIPSHLRHDELFIYREGVVIDRPNKVKFNGGNNCWCHVGLKQEVLINVKLEVGTRCTVKLDVDELMTYAKLHRVNNHENTPSLSTVALSKFTLHGTAVSSSTPRSEHSLYWGYTVRLASSFSKVWKECPFNKGKGGYDLCIGTSDKGMTMEEIRKSKSFPSVDTPLFSPFHHSLVVFGGVNGLEDSFESDETCEKERLIDMFDHYVNIKKFQGTRTIRTEEVVFLTFQTLEEYLMRKR